MAIVLNPQDPAIVQGIKTVGIGKKGSQDLSIDLAAGIKSALTAHECSPAAMGAFFAGLINKGLTEIDEDLLNFYAPGAAQDIHILIHKLGADAPDWVKALCVRLSQGQQLSKEEAYQIGGFLFSTQKGDGLRGFIASFLRVRYETDDEYEGLLKSLQDTIVPDFLKPITLDKPLVQIAEPFDGADHSWMITPLLGKFIKKLGFNVVHMTGKNSGPKWVMNVLDMAHFLGEKEIHSSNDLLCGQPTYGWFCNTNRISPAIERWHAIRKQIIKRPFLSTLERFINPFNADILIASAFHPPYGAKMLTIAKRNGFKKIIIVRNGIEGSIAFPLLRPVKVLVATKSVEGQYEQQEFNLEASQFIQSSVTVEERIDDLTVEQNVALINNHIQQGKSGNQAFDDRLTFTCKGIKHVLG